MPEDRTREQPFQGPLHMDHDDDTYGGFWRRAGAVTIDGGVLAIPTWLFHLLLERVSAGAPKAVASWTFGSVLGWLYFAVQESGARRATLGKLAFGLRVTDGDLNRISFGRASLRYAGKVATSFTFGLGYVAAAFNDRRRTLHDAIAGTVVPREGASLSASALFPLVVLGLLAGLLPLDRSGLIRLSTPPCPPSPGERTSTGLRATLPEQFPLPKAVLLSSVERSEDRLALEGVWPRTSVPDAFELYRSGLPFEYFAGPSTVGSTDATFEFSGLNVAQATVDLQACKGGVTLEVDARFGPSP